MVLLSDLPTYKCAVKLVHFHFASCDFWSVQQTKDQQYHKES